MKNSYYHDQSVEIFFYNGKVFKNKDDFVTYLQVSCNHTPTAIDIIVTNLPVISKTDALEFLTVAKLNHPRTGVSKLITTLSDKTTTVETKTTRTTKTKTDSSQGYTPATKSTKKTTKTRSGKTKRTRTTKKVS